MLYLFLKALVWLIPIWIIRKKKYCSWDQFKWSLREISKKKDWLTFGFLMFGDKMFWGLCSGFLYWGFIFGRSGLGVHFRTFGVRTLGGPFSDVRGSFSDVRGSGFIFGRSGFGRSGCLFRTFGVHFRTFGVEGSFSDVRGSDVGGAFFGRSGLNPECPKTLNLQIRTFGVEPRTSEIFNVQNRTFGVFIFGRSGLNPEHKNPERPKTPNVRIRTFGVEPRT